MSTTNKTLIFKKVPASGLPVAGEHLVVSDLGPFDPTAAPPPGGLTLSILQVSLDPFLTDKMRDASIESYTPAYSLGGPMTNDAVARVIQSSAPGFAAGDLVLANLPFAEYAVLDPAGVATEVRAVLSNPYGWHGRDLGLFLGPLGMTGLTAWSSLYEIGKPKAGETIFVSSAAGAVGQMVGQIAKREGLRVIGSVGSDDKLAFIVDELGFDAGFNYKKEKAVDALARLAPKGIDIYFDNVGGEQLDAALWSLKERGRIVACGMITQYNRDPKDWDGVKNLLMVVDKRLTMRGFIVADPDFGQAYLEDHQTKMRHWLHDGSIKAKLDVTEGIENAIQGLLDLFSGKNFGKAVLKIKDE